MQSRKQLSLPTINTPAPAYACLPNPAPIFNGQIERILHCAVIIEDVVVPEVRWVIYQNIRLARELDILGRIPLNIPEFIEKDTPASKKVRIGNSDTDFTHCNKTLL
jgi:hypothetical protein